MKPYSVILSKSAEKELERLPGNVLQRVVMMLENLKTDPRPPGCKKLKGFKNLWRVRTGDYRIIYAIEDKILLVDVRAVGHRSEVYD